MEIVEIEKDYGELGRLMDGLAREVVAGLTKWYRLPLEPEITWVRWEAGRLGFVTATETDFWLKGGPDFSRWRIYLVANKLQAHPVAITHVVSHEVAHLHQSLRDGRILSRHEEERYAEMEARFHCRRLGRDSYCPVCAVPLGEFLRAYGNPATT